MLVPCYACDFQGIVELATLPQKFMCINRNAMSKQFPDHAGLRQIASRGTAANPETNTADDHGKFAFLLFVHFSLTVKSGAPLSSTVTLLRSG